MALIPIGFTSLKKTDDIVSLICKENISTGAAKKELDRLILSLNDVMVKSWSSLWSLLKTRVEG